MKFLSIDNLLRTLLLIGIIILFSYLGCTWNDKSKENPANTTVIINEKEAVELKLTMRKLWEDHIIWTRNVILCLADELPGTDEAVKRLLQNQVDIGNALKPYYGEETGEALTDLLYPHIIIFAEVIVAEKAKNTVALKEANKGWYANADLIAGFLNKINPNWELTEMKMMMKEHLLLTNDEMKQRINKNYTADIVAYDKAHEAILKMADMFTEGIIKQFPEKFETDNISLK